MYKLEALAGERYPAVARATPTGAEGPLGSAPWKRERRSDNSCLLRAHDLIRPGGAGGTSPPGQLFVPIRLGPENRPPGAEIEERPPTEEGKMTKIDERSMGEGNSRQSPEAAGGLQGDPAGQRRAKST